MLIEPGFGELDGVADQVHQHLGEAALVAPAARQIRRHVDLERELLLGRERLGRAHHVEHQLAHRVIDRREGQLARLDLGQIEHVVDQAEQMAAVLLDALEHVLHLRGHVAVDAVLDQLGIAEHGVQGRPQLVAHVGQELGLVPARRFQLAGLFLDLVEQAGVVDRERGLRGE